LKLLHFNRWSISLTIGIFFVLSAKLKKLKKEKFLENGDDDEVCIILSPINKIIDHSYTALRTIQNFEFRDFLPICSEAQRNLLTFSIS